jgi:hypothetical protein
MNLFQKIHNWYLQRQVERKLREYDENKAREMKALADADSLRKYTIEFRDSIASAGLVPINHFNASDSSPGVNSFYFLDKNHNLYVARVGTRGGTIIKKVLP